MYMHDIYNADNTAEDTRDPFRWAAVEFNGRSYTCLYTFLGLYLPTCLLIMQSYLLYYYIMRQQCIVFSMYSTAAETERRRTENTRRMHSITINRHTLAPTHTHVHSRERGPAHRPRWRSLCYSFKYLYDTKRNIRGLL